MNDIPLATWFEFTSANKITFEIKDFLKNEIALQARDDIDVWRDDLIALFNYNLAVGMPFAGIANPPANLRELEQRTAAAELALLSSISACTDVIITLCNGDFSDTNIRRIRWHPEWPDKERSDGRSGAFRRSAMDLLRRLEMGTADDRVARQSMRGIDLDHQIIRIDCDFAYWSFANAQLIDLYGINLYGANLDSANLSRANLTFANLYGANLTGANLTRASLDSADLDRANLAGADLDRANLTRADLRETQGLTEAQLKRAHNWQLAKLPKEFRHLQKKQ